MIPTLNTRGDTPLLPVPIPFLRIRGDLILLEHFSVFAKTIKVGKTSHCMRQLCAEMSLVHNLTTIPGDVVTAHSVQNPRHIVCKRVLGLEGDTVKVPWSSTNGPARTVKV